MQIRQFAKDYRLPIQATTLFIVIVLMMLFVRFYELSVLAGVLDGGSNKSQDYASLLSVDKNDELNKNEVNEKGAAVASEPKKSISSDKESAPLTVSPGGSGGTAPSSVSNPTASPTLGGSAVTSAPAPAPGPTSPDPPESPSSQPMTVTVEGVGLESIKDFCDPSVSGLRKCYKVYTFKGSIKTVDGPGDVTYGWRLTKSGFDQDGSFSAGSGETYTYLPKIVRLDCSQPVQFSVRLITKSPDTDQSDSGTITHFCENFTII